MRKKNQILKQDKNRNNNARMQIFSITWIYAVSSAILVYRYGEQCLVYFLILFGLDFKLFKCIKINVVL